LNKLKAIIVDDEESARDVLGNLLLRFCPEIELIAKCEDIPSAVKSIEALKPDLVFLDIELPNHSGFEIIDFIKPIDFEIIFVTAYDQYAIKAFEIAAIDYLLKPIDISRLKNAVKRVVEQSGLEQQNQKLSLLSNTLEVKEISKIIVNDKGTQNIVELENIIAIEAQESYCIIHTTDKQFMISKNLKFYEQLLDSVTHFIRVHKSWMINTKHIQQYSKSDLLIKLSKDITAKLSKYKKLELENLIQ
jgi:two-component system LytT family response regulator